MAEQTYDGFISYSHAADDLLAPRLQAGVQRFAKPWWKRRAVRIFRDEASLAANPHLWSSITEALDTSGWFVLLLSPDAATSEWVGKEIDHWKQHNDPSRILPVVTDGTFGWADGDVTGTSVPDALRGVFTEEPRWVDLRFARGDDQLDLKNPTFSAAIADVASAIRGIPKDELESEEVRQHRRTIRTAWAAATVVLLLGVAAAIGAVVAVNQSNEAQTQRDEAERLAEAETTARAEADANAVRAEQNAEEASDNAARADANADRAEQNAALATARELAASAINLLDEDPELSILLGLEAIASTPAGQDQPVEVINALWTAVQEDRLLQTVETGYTDGLFLALSPDESTLFVVVGIATIGYPRGLAVQAYSTATFEKLWEYEGTVANLETFQTTGLVDGDLFFGQIHVSPDGRRLSLGTTGDSSATIILDAGDGTEDVTMIAPRANEDDPGSLGCTDETGVFPWGWSPDATRFVVTGTCPRADVDGDSWVEILDGETLAPLAVIGLPGDGKVIASFDNAGRLFLFTRDEGVTILDSPDYSTSTTWTHIRGLGDVSPDGSFIVTLDITADCRSESLGDERQQCGTLAVFDASTGDRIDVLTPLPTLPDSRALAAMFSGVDELIAVPTAGAETLLWDLTTGEQVLALPSGTGTNAISTSDGERLFTGHLDGRFKVWYLRPPAVGLDPVADLGTDVAIAEKIVKGEHVGAFTTVDSATSEPLVHFFDLATGQLMGQPIAGHVNAGATLVGDRFLVAGVDPGDPYPWFFYDPVSGDRTPFAGCDLDLATGLCPDGEDPRIFWWVASLDGSELLRQRFDLGPMMLIDPDDGSVIAPLVSELEMAFLGTFSDEFLIGSDFSALKFEDRASGEEVARLSHAGQEWDVSHDRSLIAFNRRTDIAVINLITTETWVFPIDMGEVKGIAVDAASRRVALSDESGISTFDFDTGERLIAVPIPGIVDIHWLSEDLLLVTTQTGGWATISLMTDDLISSAAAGVTRGLTAEECATYRIDPCPTLEEMRAR